MARKRVYEDARPKSDVYTGLLAISLVAMVASCVMLYLDYSQYPTAKPPAPAALPTTAPRPVSQGQLPPPPPLEDRPVATTPAVASGVQPVSGTEVPNVPAPVVPAVAQEPVPAPAPPMPPAPTPVVAEAPPAPTLSSTPPTPAAVVSPAPQSPPVPTPVPAPQLESAAGRRLRSFRRRPRSPKRRAATPPAATLGRAAAGPAPQTETPRRSPRRRTSRRRCRRAPAYRRSDLGFRRDAASRASARSALLADAGSRRPAADIRERTLAMLPILLTSLALAADALHVENPTVDAGERRSGQPLVARFTLVNAGRESLEVTELTASCGCATPKLGSRSLAPGERAEVALDVNTLSQPTGPNRWTLTVGWRAGTATGRQILELTATLIREVELSPAALVLSGGRGLTHDVTLTDRRSKPLRVTGIRTDSPRLTAELLPGAGSMRTVRLRVADDCPEGRHADALRIATDDPAYPELVLPVTLVREAKARVTAAPARATLVPGGASILLQLRDADGKPVVVERVEPGHAAVTSRWASGPSVFSTLRLGVDRTKWTGGSWSGDVRVILREPAGQVVTIPVAVSE
ncbi:MAG: DUF1573 domain-containing protein [Gemmataceae bacterium]